MEYDEAITAALRAEKAAADISTQVLADRSGVPKRTLERYMNGDREPRIGVLAKIAFGLGMPLSRLLAEAERRIALDSGAGEPTQAELDAITRRVVEGSPDGLESGSGGGPSLN